MLTTGRRDHDPIGQARLDQKLNEELESTRSNFLTNIDMGNTDDLSVDVKGKINTALAAINSYACKNTKCPIYKAKTPHFHCKECGAPYRLNYHNWHDVINRPKECQWCHHRIDYTNAINSAILDAKNAIMIEAADKEAAYRHSRDLARQMQHNQAVFDAAHNLNGYWRNGSFYHNSGEVSGYDQEHPDANPGYDQDTDYMNGLY